MNAMHPSFGPVPPEIFAKAASMPYGSATSMLRKFDPLFGMNGENDGPQKRFKVEVSKTISVAHCAQIEIEATSEDHARQIASNMDDDEFDWAESYGSKEEDNFEIDRVKEITA